DEGRDSHGVSWEVGRAGGAGPVMHEGRPRDRDALRRSFRWPGASLAGDDVDDLATTTGAERDGTGSQCEQGVVATATAARTRVEARAALADDDLAGADDLTAVALHAQTLGV